MSIDERAIPRVPYVRRIMRMPMVALLAHASGLTCSLQYREL